MDVTPLVKEGAQIIQGYANGSFRISGKVFKGAVFVLMDQSIAWGFDGDAKALSEADFQILIEDHDNIDVVLLGTGAALTFPDPALKRVLKERGLNVEVMDSGAACRTYNVLMAEGRRVVAALLPL
ncbi:MAG: Mth938-like domain-containing protein [Bdellovibrionales bacterium]